MEFINAIKYFFQWLGTWRTNDPITVWVASNIILLFIVYRLGSFMATRTKGTTDDSFWKMFRETVLRIKPDAKLNKGGEESEQNKK